MATNNLPIFTTTPSIEARNDYTYKYNIRVEDPDIIIKNVNETTQYSIIRNGQIDVIKFGLIPNAEHLINSNFDSSQIDYDFIVSGVNHYTASTMNYRRLYLNKTYFYDIISENGSNINYGGDIGWVWGYYDKNMNSSGSISDRFTAWANENNVPLLLDEYSSWSRNRAGFILDFESQGGVGLVHTVSYYVKDTRSGAYTGSWDIWGVNSNGELTYITETANGILSSQNQTINIPNSNFYSKYIFVTHSTSNVNTNTRMMFTKFNAFGETRKEAKVSISTPSLPAWLTLTDNGDNTGILEGTPSQLELGETIINLQATDPEGGITEQNFTINVISKDFPAINSEPITTISEYNIYNYTLVVGEYQPLPTINSTTQYTVNRTNGDTYVLEFGLIPNAEHLIDTDFDSNNIEYSFIVSGVNHYSGSLINYRRLDSNRNYFYNVISENGSSIHNYNPSGSGDIGWNWGDRTYTTDDGSFSNRFTNWANENNVPLLLDEYSSKSRAGFILDFAAHGKKGLVNKVSYTIIDNRSGNYTGSWDIWGVDSSGVLTEITTTSTNILLAGDNTIEFSNSKYYDKYIFVTSTTSNVSDGTRLFFTRFNAFGGSFISSGNPIPQQTITSSNLPAWLSLTDNGDNTATLRGTPNETNIGITNVNIITSGDNQGNTLSQTFDINVLNNTTPDLLVATGNGIEYNDSIVSGSTFTNLLSDIDFINNRTAYATHNRYAYIPNNDHEAHSGYNSMKFEYIIPSSVLSSTTSDRIRFQSASSTSDVMLYFWLSARLEKTESYWTFRATELDFYYRANNQDNKLTGRWNNDWNALINHKFHNNLDLEVNFYINFDSINSELQSSMEIIASSGENSYTVGANHTVDITTLDPPLEAAGFYQLRPNDSRNIYAYISDIDVPTTSITISGIANLNKTPVLTTTESRNILQDTLYTYNINVSDEDGDTVAITANTLPSWLTLVDNGDNTAILSGTPSSNESGTSHSVDFSINDGKGGIINDTFSITVHDRTNLIESTENGIEFNNSIVSGSAFTNLLDGINFINNSTLTRFENDGRVDFNSNEFSKEKGYKSMKFSWSIPSNVLSNTTANYIYFRSANSTSNVMLYFWLTARLENKGGFWTFRATELDFYYRANNQDNKLTGRWNNDWNALINHKFHNNLDLEVNFYINFDSINSELQSSMEIIASSGENSYTVGANHTVDITTLDPPLEAEGFYQPRSNRNPSFYAYETGLDDFLIPLTVYAIDNENSPPAFITTPILSVMQNTLYTYNITVTDNENDISTITAPALPSWLTLVDNGNNTAILTGTPTIDEIGSNPVILSSDDNNGGIKTQSFSINVIDSTNLIKPNENGRISVNGNISTISRSKIKKLPKIKMNMRFNANYNNTKHRINGPWALKFKQKLVEVLGGNYTIDHIIIHSITSGSVVVDYDVSIPEEDTNETDFNLNNTATTIETTLTNESTNGNLDVDGESSISESIVTIQIEQASDSDILDLNFSENLLLGSATTSLNIPYSTLINNPNGYKAMQFKFILPSSVLTTTTEDIVFFSKNTNADFLLDFILESSLVYSDTYWSFSSTDIHFNIIIDNQQQELNSFSPNISHNFSKELDLEFNFIIYYNNPSLDFSLEIIATDNLGNSFNIGDTLTMDISSLSTSPLEAQGFYHLKNGSSADLNVYLQNFTNTNTEIKVYGMTDVLTHPVFISFPITTINEDKLYEYIIQVDDNANGSNIEIGHVSLPSWLTLTDNENNSGLLSGTPLQNHIGDNRVIIEAVQVSGLTTIQDFIINVNNVNDLPLFSSSPVLVGSEDNLYTYNITVSDEDGDNVVITASKIPSWLTLTDNGDNTATLMGIPLQVAVGDNIVKLVATDPFNFTAEQNFTINVENTNDNPVFTSSPVLTTFEDSVYTYNITVSDEDGDTVSITASTLPDWLTLTDNGNNTAILSGTPLQNNVGINPVVLVGTDINNAITNINFDINVLNVNDNPIITSSPVLTVDEDSLYSYNITVSDEDGGTVAITASTLPDWLTLIDNGNNTASLSGTPLQSNIGNHSVIIIATDSENGTHNQNFNINVSSVNDNPVFTSSPIIVGDEDSLYTYNITVTDEENEDVTITYSTLPDWLTLTDNGDNTATLSGTPLQTHIGEHTVVIIASDTSGGMSNQEFTIVIASVNDLPLFTEIAPTTATKLKLYNYNINITDEENEDVTITASTLPDWLTLLDYGNSTGKLSGIPLAQHIGNNEVILIATDTAGGLTYNQFVIIVSEPNAPEAPDESTSISTRSQLNLSGEDGSSITINSNISESTLITNSKMKFEVQSLDISSGSNVVENVAHNIILNRNNLSQEIIDRTTEDNLLQSNINTEIENRITAVTSEATTRATNDSILQTNIINEATARETQDTALQGNITSEETARIAADNILTNNLNQEILDRQNAILLEQNSRITSLNNLQQTIDNLEISTNSNRNSDKNNLQEQIDIEKERINAIMSMSLEDLNTFREISDSFKQADSDLTTLINNLTTEFNALKLVVDTLATNYN